MNKVIKTERGWGGHFICSNSCLFRRNTLLEFKDKKIIVSTVGNMYRNGELTSIGAFKRIYETMAFEADTSEYKDADVSKEIAFNSNWALEEQNDNKANLMHEVVVEELTNKIQE